MSKKRDSKPLYVPPRPSPARTRESKPRAAILNGDIVDGIAELNIKPVNAKKAAITKVNHDREKPTEDGKVVDSWEDIFDSTKDKDKPVSEHV